MPNINVKRFSKSKITDRPIVQSTQELEHEPQQA